MFFGVPAVEGVLGVLSSLCVVVVIVCWLKYWVAEVAIIFMQNLCFVLLKMKTPSRTTRSSLRSSTASSNKALKEDVFDFTGFLASTKAAGDKSNDEVIAEGALDHSRSYLKVRCSVICSFLETLALKSELFVCWRGFWLP